VGPLGATQAVSMVNARSLDAAVAGRMAAENAGRVPAHVSLPDVLVVIRLTIEGDRRARQNGESTMQVARHGGCCSVRTMRLSYLGGILLVACTGPALDGAVACIPHSTRCESATAELVCSFDGRALERRACGRGEACLDSAVGGACARADSIRLLEENLDATMSLWMAGSPACTAFLVSDDVVLTNEHCCSSREACADALVVPRYRADDAPSDGYPVVEELGRWASHDVLALRVGGNPGRDRRPVLFAASAPERRAPIYIVGHPGGRPLESSLGLLVHRRSEIVYDYAAGRERRLDQVLYAAAAEPGSSGSPVFFEETNALAAVHHSGGVDAATVGLSRVATAGFGHLLGGTDAPALADLLESAGIEVERVGTAEPASAPARLAVTVHRRYPHATDAFTQGLLWHDGALYESTGIRGESTLRVVDPETGEVLVRSNNHPDEFAEGLALDDGRLFQLTWQSEVAHVYALEPVRLIGSRRYAGEGWGLTSDGTHLVMSNGSDVLSFRDPETFSEIRRLNVHDEHGFVDFINELEWAEGSIWANVWQTDDIVRIDPDSGLVTGVADVGDLLSDEERAIAGVANGIAYRPDNGHFMVTGKYWPWVFEVSFGEES